MSTNTPPSETEVLRRLADPAHYPRTYRVSTGWQIFLYLVGLMFLGFGVFVATKLGQPKDALFAALFAPLLAILGGYIILDTFKSKIILHADAIEVIDLLPPRRLMRADIKGRQLQDTGQGVATVFLMPKDAGMKKLKIPVSMIRMDEYLAGWIGTLPDLDAENAQKMEAEILGDPDSGRTAEEGRTELNAARKKAKLLSGITAMCGVWVYFYPEPYAAAVAALSIMPWAAIALAATAPRLYTFNDKRQDPRAGLGVSVMVPGLILALRFMLDFNVVSLSQVHWGAAAITLLLTFILTRLDPRLIASKAVLILLPLILPYGYGTLLMADVLLDSSAPKVFETKIIDKHYTSGKGAHPELTVAPWGGMRDNDKLAVPRSLYKIVSPGSPICIYLRPGALGVAWYRPDLCGKDALPR